MKTMYNEIEGDLIELGVEGVFDVIVHGCNCMSTMGSGIAVKMARKFGCDKFEMESWGKSVHKLGCIDYKYFSLSTFGIWQNDEESQKNNNKTLCVVNAYTQYYYGRNHIDGDIKPIDYQALTLCMRKLNIVFKGKHIGFPYVIGCGLGGGDESIVINIIKKELKNCKVTLVKFKK